MRKEVFLPDEYYHIYNRGVDKRVVFLSDRDRFRFINALYVLNNFKEIPYRFDMQSLSPRELLIPQKPFVRIVAGCLMPNHFHLLVTPLKERGVSGFFHKIGVSYAMYFNKRHERTGRLFEGTFKARHVDSHEYINYLTQYIHLNPFALFQTKSGIKEKSLEEVKRYPWSSAADYIGKRSNLSLIIDKKFRDEVLGVNEVEYEKFLDEMFQT